ncbi:MAG TPA: hypothetical protein VN181_06650, partial [Thermoanaerobaculia bacterium]|nr:hypothetical protein [Thermoanaerobaculia bacterium]
PQAKEGTPEFRFNWNSPFVISHFDPKTLYLGGNVLFRFTNRGDAWEVISPDLTTRDPDKMVTSGSSAENHCTIVAVSESPKDRNVLWAGTDDGNVQFTRDGGKSWTKADVPTRGMWVSRVQASNHDSARAYVAVDGHRSDDFHPYLYATDDAGKTWRSIVRDLPANHPIKGLREDPVNPSLLFVGTEFGIFMSLDRGEHWQSLKENLPTVAVDDIQIHPREHDLIIGTHGRSIYVMDDISPLEQLTSDRMKNAAVLFTPRPVTEFYSLPIGGLWGAHEFRAKNPPSGASITYWLRDDSKDDVELSIEDPKGTLVRELDATSHKGFNRVGWDLRGDPLDVIGEGRSEDDQPPLVPAGDYVVKMKYGDFKAETKLRVESLISPTPSSP